MSIPELKIDELTSDIKSSRVRDLIKTHKNLGRLLTGGRERTEEVRDQQHYLKQYEERRWLIRKGKKYLIDFDNDQRRQMKHYFNSLDGKRTGSIGIDELEELLFSVGLFETREEIKALIDSVDQDRSGKIEFGEFLSMIQNDEGQNEEIVAFFKTVIGGKLRQNKKLKQNFKNQTSRPFMERSLNKTASASKDIAAITFRKQAQSNAFLQYGQENYHSKSQIPQILKKYPYPKGLPFEMVVSHIRRKHMMTALNIGHPAHKDNIVESQPQPENTPQQIAKGQRVMHALQKMYERKLIRQIKQSKRNGESIKPEKNFRISMKENI